MNIADSLFLRTFFVIIMNILLFYDYHNFFHVMKRRFMNFEQQHNDMHDLNDENAKPESCDQAKPEEQLDKDETLRCLAELSMWQDQCKRISAEFENFKRRTDKDRARIIEFAKESILLELLSFFDTFELALQQKNSADNAGIQMVHQALIKLLHKHDVVAMSSTKVFDPEFHEAVMQIQSDQHQSGEIVDILSQGFMLKDRVLRPARVSVAV